MRMGGVREICCVTTFCLIAARGQNGSAQLYEVRGKQTAAPSSPQVRETTVSVELITGAEGVGLSAQQWSQVFSELKIPIQIRRAKIGEQPGVHERMLGRSKMVTVIGQLDRRGRIVLPEQTFDRSDVPRLVEWLRELETYGAKGSPEGKPLWGLDEGRFAGVYSALSVPVKTDVDGKELLSALPLLPLPEKYPLRIGTEGREWLRQQFSSVPTVRQTVTGLSAGTALAIMLNDYGLGFRPLRTPEGTIELVVDPLTRTADVWPIGWEVNPLDRRKKAPKMFDFVPVELEEIPLEDLFHGVSVKTETPVLIDYYRAAAYQIDIEQARFTHPMASVAWSLLLKRAANSVKLTREIKADEAGRAFVWISPIQALQRTR